MERKAYPSDVSDAEWALVALYLTLMTEDAPQRNYPLREVFNGLQVASPVGGRAEFRVDVSIPPVSERLRAITGNPGRSTLPGLRYSDVKERRGNTDLKLITRSKSKHATLGHWYGIARTL